jgi:hypothetical protein
MLENHLLAGQKLKRSGSGAGLDKGHEKLKNQP